MKITRHITDDKLQLLILAGIAPEGGRGWDYAIPQPWADDLQQMGIQNPGQWFVADCVTSISPQLHHIGEAWAAILNHRAQANDEYIWQLAQNNESPLYKFIVGHPAEDIRAECGVGLINYNHVATIFDAGYAEGQKDILPLIDIMFTKSANGADLDELLEDMRRIKHAIKQH